MSVEALICQELAVLVGGGEGLVLLSQAQAACPKQSYSPHPSLPSDNDAWQAKGTNVGRGGSKQIRRGARGGWETLWPFRWSCHRVGEGGPSQQDTGTLLFACNNNQAVFLALLLLQWAERRRGSSEGRKQLPN